MSSNIEMSFDLEEYNTWDGLDEIAHRFANRFSDRGKAIFLYPSIEKALMTLMPKTKMTPASKDDLYTLKYNGNSFSIVREKPCRNLDMGVQ